MSTLHRTRRRLGGFRGFRGFTVLELVIAMVVIAVLASLAFPSLLGAIRKSRRAEAISKINTVQLAQERFRSNNPVYAADLSSAAPAGLGIPATTGDGRYTITLEAVAAASAPTNYAVVAAPIVGSTQVNDGTCSHLRLRVANGNTFYESSSTSAGFTEALGRNCWAR